MGNKNTGPLLNVLTALLLLGVLCLAGLFGVILINPDALPDPLQPPPLPTMAELPTPTATSRIPTLPPAWTATPTPPPQATLTRTPALTPTDLPAPTPGASPTLSPTPGPALSPTPSALPSPTLTPTPTTPAAAIVPVIANPSFEGTWSTDGFGNQHPAGWTLFSPAEGAFLPYPTKGQQGETVDAISGGPGEYVHKLAEQLPPDERIGQPRAIVLHGDRVYKAFGTHGPHALRMSQIIEGTPGSRVRVTVYILGESNDEPDPELGHLEDDHFIASVALGAALDKRQYADMTARSDLAGNERHWNRYVLENTFPANGQLELAIILQQNWPGNTDFFVDNLSAELVP